MAETWKSLLYSSTGRHSVLRLFSRLVIFLVLKWKHLLYPCPN